MTNPIKVPTRPTPVVSRWERFKRLTVWHPIHTDPADDNRWTPRVWLPTYDLLAIALGIYAIIYGSPLLNHLFSKTYTNIGGALIILASIAMLVGVCFPKLMLMELIGKMFLVFMLGAYAGTVGVLGKSNENGFVVIILVMAVWLLLPRITVLFGQLAKRRIAKQQLEELHKARRH